MESGNEEEFLRIVNEYGLALMGQGFVTENTKSILKELRSFKEIKALKGCGAMGAEVIIVFYKKEDDKSLREKLSHLEIITDSSQITYGVEAHSSKNSDKG